ncbi:MAG: FAD-binding oxidoreductase [Candidatus Methanomethylophilaceae archaeon]
MGIEPVRAIRVPSVPFQGIKKWGGTRDSLPHTFLTDESKLSGHAKEIYFPSDESQLATLLRHLNRTGGHATISGMRTGVVGGAVPQGGSVICMENMDSLIGLGKDQQGYFVRVQPNMTLRSLQRILRQRYSSLPALQPGVGEEMDAQGPFFYPVDPTEQNGSLGGNVAANSSGARSFRYGPTRDWVRRLRVMLPNGDILDIVRGEHGFQGRECKVVTEDDVIHLRLPSYDFNRGVKNSAGLYCHEDMDLIDLFIGSEGTLGVITEIDLRLMPSYPVLSILVFFPDDGKALSFVADLRLSSSIRPDLIEYFDEAALGLIRDVKAKGGLRKLPCPPSYAGSAVFLDLPAGAEDISSVLESIRPLLRMHGGSPERSWCLHDRRGREMLRDFRHSIPETIFQHVGGLKGKNPGIHKMGTDVSVPDAAFPEMMEYYAQTLRSKGLRWVTFGHVGDNHPHVEVILHDMDDFRKAKDACQVFAHKAVQLGGSPSAEHGIGKLKREYLPLLYGSQGCKELQALKRSVDPNGVLNRGNLMEW